MTMHWNTYLVRLYTDVNHMNAWDERMRRTQLITEGFIRPQAQEMALALDDARNALESLDLNHERDTPTHPNSIIAHIEPRIRLMAIHDQYDNAPCVMPIMMWDYLYEVVRETLSPEPSKKEIKQLRKTCIALLDDGIDRDPKIVKEIYRTIGVINTVLEEWFINEHHPLRFYAEKPNWFDRYSI